MAIGLVLTDPIAMALAMQDTLVKGYTGLYAQIVPCNSTKPSLSFSFTYFALSLNNTLRINQECREIPNFQLI